MTKLVIILIISRYFVILNVFWHKLMETNKQERAVVHLELPRGERR